MKFEKNYFIYSDIADMGLRRLLKAPEAFEVSRGPADGLGRKVSCIIQMISWDGAPFFWNI